MKINKIILFSLLILVIFTLGAVSAADSNDTALSDGILDDASVVNLDESSDDEYYNVYIDSYYVNDTSSEYPNEISVDIWDSEMSGNISISVDDVEYYHAQSTERMSHFLNIDKLNLSY